MYIAVAVLSHRGRRVALSPEACNLIEAASVIRKLPQAMCRLHRRDTETLDAARPIARGAEGMHAHRARPLG